VPQKNSDDARKLKPMQRRNNGDAKKVKLARKEAIIK
jgi:hypothetical protein